MNCNKNNLVLLFLILFILFCTGCKGETGKISMKDFLVDELWDMEADALDTLKKLKEIGDDKQEFISLCKNSFEIMSKVKVNLNNYSGADENAKKLLIEQHAYCDFFLQTVTGIEKSQDDSSINAIINKWESLLKKKDITALEILKGIDINDTNGREYIEKYLDTIYTHNIYEQFINIIRNENPSHNNYIPLLYAIAILKHFETAGEEEYSVLMILRESSGLSSTIEDWISKRLHYIDLYNNCGTPGFWTEDKIKIEKGLINSLVKTGWNIYSWLNTCYEKEEYLLAENLARLFTDKKGIITKKGEKISGAEYMEKINYSHFTELSSVIKALIDFAQVFVARDLMKITGYINETVSIQDFPDNAGKHQYNKDEFEQYADDLFEYIEYGSNGEGEYTINGNGIDATITYTDSFQTGTYVEIVCYFDYVNHEIILTTIETNRSYTPGFGGGEENYGYYDYGESWESYGYDGYEEEGTPFVNSLSDEELTVKLTDFAHAFIEQDQDRIDEFMLYGTPHIDDPDFKGIEGSETIFDYLEELNEVIKANACNKPGIEIDDDFDNDFSVWVSIVYYCGSEDKSIQVTCFFHIEHSDVIIFDSIETVRFRGGR